MSASIFGDGTNPLAAGRTVRQEFTATGGQTVFDLTLFTYTPGNGSLEVYVNGILQRLTTDYVETSSTRITMVEGLLVGDYLTAKGYL
jgi:hypothetical protein